MPQGTLPFDRRDSRSIQERFDGWIARHPEVYVLFRQFALELLAAGRKRFSSDAIVQRIRWYYAVNPTKEEGFVVNDHWSSRLARKLMEDDGRFVGFFETRALKRD